MESPANGISACWRPPRGIGGESDHHRQPDAALTNFNQSLQILREIGMQKDLGNILLNRGVLYRHAATWIRRSKTIRTRCKSSAIRRTLIAGIVSQRYRAVYFEKRQPITYYQQSSNCAKGG